MARNFVFTPPLSLCKKFEPKFFRCDCIRLNNSCCVVAFNPPSQISCAEIHHKFYIGLTCRTFWGWVVLLTNGKFSFINSIVSKEKWAPAKSCTNWKLNSLWCLCMNGKSRGCNHLMILISVFIVTDQDGRKKGMGIPRFVRLITFVFMI